MITSNNISQDLKKKGGLKVNDNSLWESIRSQVRENQDFFDNNKNDFINQVIANDYTVNYDVIPIIPLPITSYMTKIKSNHYNKSYILETEDKNSDFKKHISFKKLKLALSKFLIGYHLHGAAFIRVSEPTSKKRPKLTFVSINPMDIIYNYKFTEVVVRIDTIVGDNTIVEYKYEFYKEVNADTWTRKQFVAGDWGTFNTDNLDNVKDVKVSTHGIIPIVPLFKTETRLSQKSVFVFADLILNILLGFGMANVPTALLVKIWVKNQASGGVSMDDKLDSLSDIMDVLPLGEKEEAGTLQTGDLMSFKNFFTVFESLLTHIAQLEGIPRSAMQIASPTRQSGAAKQTDNRSSSIYRDLFIMELDEFEDRLFDVINEVLDTDYEFMNIDKSTTITLSSREILDEMIIAVTNGFEDFVTAIAKYKKISREAAEAYLEQIMESRDTYGDLLAGIPGMPMSGGAGDPQGKGEAKKDEGITKGDKKNEQADKP